MTQRCPNCDDTGDVHGLDGEWRGRCYCPAGSALAAPAAAQGAVAETFSPAFGNDLLHSSRLHELWVKCAPAAKGDAVGELKWQLGCFTRLVQEEVKAAIAATPAHEAAPSAPVLESNQRIPLAVLQALRFYANGEHFSDADEKLDDVSGEPANWLCHEDDATMLENGLVARMALQGQPLAWEAGCEPEPLDGEVFAAIKEKK